jgi:lipopolysaccharide export system permease protein
MLATYSVCLFILLMHFVWQFVNDMVGKGVGIGVIGELFFYAAVSFTPMALPLAVLLASLMTFGNLGEHLELLAMKASGISLVRIMKPLIWFTVATAGLSFFCQNEMAPRARAKMYTIVLSLRQKSPELDIPEGIFCKDITGYNVFVRKKNKDGLLRDLMIYNYSDGFENAEIVVADSGRMNVSADKKFLALRLYHGVSFRNYGQRRSRNLNETVPYMRERFALRDVLIDYDTNFSLVDENIMGNRDISKNMQELTTFIDSTRADLDSTYRQTAVPFRDNIYAAAFQTYSGRRATASDTLFADGFGPYFQRLAPDKQLDYLRLAKGRAEQIGNDYAFTSLRRTDAEGQLRSHRTQYWQRYAMALSCVLFFFVGAPLGAIIRKGGLGMPAVLAVLIYLTYYIVDTFGVKMAKQGVWPIGEGVWVSTALLVAMGIFFTYKAVNDSTMIDADAWQMWLRRLTGRREVRRYVRKEVIMTPPDYINDRKALKAWNIACAQYLDTLPPPSLYGTPDARLAALTDDLERIIEDLSNSDTHGLIAFLATYPVVRPVAFAWLEKPAVRMACRILFPLGITLFLLDWQRQYRLKKDLAAMRKMNEAVAALAEEAQ